MYTLLNEARRSLSSSAVAGRNGGISGSGLGESVGWRCAVRFGFDAFTARSLSSSLSSLESLESESLSSESESESAFALPLATVLGFASESESELSDDVEESDDVEPLLDPLSLAPSTSIFSAGASSPLSSEESESSLDEVE